MLWVDSLVDKDVVLCWLVMGVECSVWLLV